MNKKKILKIFLVLLFLIILLIFFLRFFNENKKNEEINLDVGKQNDIESNLIKEISFFPKDKKGNKYILKAKEGEVDLSNNKIIYLKKITAQIVLNNSEDIMLIGNKIPFVKENLNMKSAIKILSNKKLGVLIVQNKKKRTIGIITDGQIRRYNEKKQNLNEMNVAKIMTKKPISIDKDSLAAKALTLMNEKRITSLCVHDKKNKLKTIGILHIHSILQSNIT